MRWPSHMTRRMRLLCSSMLSSAEHWSLLSCRGSRSSATSPALQYTHHLAVFHDRGGWSWKQILQRNHSHPVQQHVQQRQALVLAQLQLVQVLRHQPCMAQALVNIKTRSLTFLIFAA